MRIWFEMVLPLNMSLTRAKKSPSKLSSAPEAVERGSEQLVSST